MAFLFFKLYKSGFLIYFHGMLLYIFNATDTWQYKIGHTKSATSKHRLKQCQTGNAAKIEMVWEYESDNAKEIEKMMHRAFLANRMSGEWFLFENQAIEELKERVKHYEEVLKILKDEKTNSYCYRY